MPDNISKQMLLSLLPPGSLWIPSEDEDFDLFLNGVAENLELMRVDLLDIAFTRNPQKTSIIGDLEKEFGLAFDSSLTDQERRDRVLSAKTANKGDGTDTFMQTKLQESGFDLFVYQNEPAVYPSLILESGFNALCGFQTSVCGHEDAVCGKTSGELVVNGISLFEDKFVIPVSSDYWHLVFFIGGPAVRDGVTNEILSIETASIPISRQAELIGLIIKYKPLHSWCGLLVGFI